MHRSDCLVCGQPLVYHETAREMSCLFCGERFTAHECCADGHYICDACHAKDAYRIIEDYCLQSASSDPTRLAEALMAHPAVNMHGPEHHFLVPAVLLASYYHARGESELLRDKLNEAVLRAQKVPGGFCGFNGSCGAAIGVGIFVSLVSDATPLSKQEWQWANLATSEALHSIALHGGPRCCKRNTFLALEAAAAFCREHLETSLCGSAFRCTYQHLNKQCRGYECLYFPHP